MRNAVRLFAGISLLALAASPAFAGSTTLALPSGTGTARVGTDGSTNLFGNVGICDGAACASMAVVKAGSTAAAAGDPSLVVGLSPNSLLPAFAATPAFTISGTLPAYAATPTFNLGTIGTAATAANQSSVIGTLAAGTSATNSLLVGCVYSSSPPTLTTGQQVAEQCDVNGNRKVTVSNTNANGAAVPGSSSPVVNAVFSHASTTALTTSLVAKASAGNLAAYNCTAVAGAAAGYCIAYNGTAAPGTGALTGSLVLDFCYFDNTPKGCSLSHIPNSIAFGTGIVILMTSAASPYTYTTGVLTGALEADYF